jgi:hypothetical protein
MFEDFCILHSWWGGKVKEYEINAVYGMYGGGREKCKQGFDRKFLRTQTAWKV